MTTTQVKVINFKSGPTAAKEIGGKFDGATKTWTVNSRKLDIAALRRSDAILSTGKAAIYADYAAICAAVDNGEVTDEMRAAWLRYEGLAFAAPAVDLLSLDNIDHEMSAL